MAAQQETAINRQRDCRIADRTLACIFVFVGLVPANVGHAKFYASRSNPRFPLRWRRHSD